MTMQPTDSGSGGEQETSTETLGKPVDSLRSRYFYKMSASGMSMMSGLLNYMFLSRGLGPVGVGKYNFLVNFFDQTFNLLDSGTLRHVYNRISQGRETKEWMGFYLLYLAGMALLVFVAVGIAIFSGFSQWIWPGQEHVYIIAAMLISLILWTMQVMAQFADAGGLTVKTERIRILQSVSGSFLLGLFFLAGYLTLSSYFLLNYFIYGTLILVWIRILGKSGFRIFEKIRLHRERIVKFVPETWRFIRPLVLYSVVGIMVGIFEKWLLQVFGGAIEQGYFWFGLRVQQFCIMFTMAFMPLIVREYAIAHDQGDNERVVGLYKRYIPLFVLFAGYLAFFVAVEAEKLTFIVGGKQFKDSSIVTAILMFQAIYFPIGNFTSSLYLATGRTALYSGIGIVGVLAGLPITFFLVAPSAYYGLGLGAVGLAIKMIIAELFITNYYLYYICRIYRMPFRAIMQIQITVPIFLLGIAVFAEKTVDYFIPGLISSFLVEGVLYTALTVAGVALFPGIFGVNRADIERNLLQPIGRLLSKKQGG